MPLTTSYLKTEGSVPLLQTTIPDHFQQVVNRFENQEAVVALPQKRRLTYRELAAEVDQLARGLLGAGFTKGERIGIWSTNNLEWLVVQMACARIGAILVNINPAYRLPELSYALKQSEVQGLFIIPAFRSSNYVAMLAELLPELSLGGSEELNSPKLPYLRRVFFYDPAAPQASEVPLPGLQSLRELLSLADQVSRAELDRVTATLDQHEPINIQYTSGTTGHPKAVILTHHNILNNGWFAAQAMGFAEQDRLCVPVPFYHCFGTVLTTLLTFSCGGCLVIACEHFEPGQVLTAIAQEKCTAIHGVPTMFIALLDHPDFKTTDTSSLRTGIMAGAPCPPPLMKRVIGEMHCSEILIGYGQTEASPLTHLTERDGSFQSRIMTVGRNLPHQEVKVVAVDDGRTLPVGEVGEICFRGYHLMKGYYNDPEGTATAIDPQGWLLSGDLGVMDGEGYVSITGRLKDMIIRGGENIYPAEIEEVLFGHPEVAQVAVFGIPDDYWGEEIMAWVKLHSGAVAVASGEDLQEFCRDKLAHFKIPHHVWLVGEFPLTVTGKVQKFRMREMAMSRMAKEGR